MPLVKKLSIAFLALVALVLVIGLFLPEKYETSASITINAPVEKVFARVNDLRAWAKWSPWHQDDKEMKLSYSDPAIGGGAWYEWQSKELGNGKMVITRSEPGKRIELMLDFADQGKSTGYWAFSPRGSNATEVTWGFKGDARNNLIERYFGLMIDAIMRPYFNRGLQNLKKLAEANA